MKKEDFLLYINEIDDAYIREAAEFELSAKRNQQKKWRRYGVLAAACLLLCALGAAQLLPFADSIEKKPAPGKLGKESAESEHLPTLSVETYAAKAEEPKQKLGNPSAQQDGNPWAEDAALAVLPVFENTAYAGEADQKAVPVEDGILDGKLRAAADMLDMTIDEIKYDRNEETGDAQKSLKATASADAGEITVTYNNFAEIRFSAPKQLPEEYTVADSAMDRENAEKVTDYLLQQYGQLMGFSSPKACVRIFYDEEGDCHWILSGYDDSENLQEQIVSYNLKRMRFILNEAGELTGIMMMDNLASGKKIEEYPIITAKEAKELLKRGEYVAGNSEIPSLSDIERFSLIYLTGPECNIFMPYYAFDVRMDEGTDDLICYSTYYVPAVRAEYLSEMPGAQR